MYTYAQDLCFHSVCDAYLAYLAYLGYLAYLSLPSLLPGCQKSELHVGTHDTHETHSINRM